MIRKMRITISQELSSSVLFKSDRTCCVCQIRGKRVQIHHIDEDPSNNTPDNLSVLCFDCHDETQIRGGFGKHLTSSVVRQYRDDWLLRVSTRRVQADTFAVSQMVGTTLSSNENTLSKPEINTPPLVVDNLYDYIDSLPSVKMALIKKCQPGWDTGNTGEMIEANNDYIYGLQGIIIGLMGYYDDKCFDGQDPHEMLSEIISSRFSWHHLQLEPLGPGTGGTIVRITCGGCVSADLDRMIIDMVCSLSGYEDSHGFNRWKQKWEGMH